MDKSVCPACHTVWTDHSDPYCPTCGQYKKTVLIAYYGSCGSEEEFDPKYDAWLLAISIAREELRYFLPDKSKGLVSKEVLDIEDNTYREEYLLNLELIDILEEWSYQIRSTR